MKISVVTPLYGSAPYIEELHRRTVAAIQAIGANDYEIIFVNDNGPDNSLVLGVTIPLPFFDRNQGGVLRSEAEMRRAENLAAATRNRIELEIRQAYNAFQINSERVEYIRSQQLQQAEKASQVTMAAYRLGGAPLMDYLDAQRRYRDTMRVFNQALFEERASRFGLAAAIGKGETE